MKKLDIFKTVQLLIYIGLAGLCFYKLVMDPDVYQQIANNPDVRLVCVLLWGIFGLSFLFLFLDFSLFSSFKRDYRELDDAVHSDPISGIANRFSCDSVIEKYLDKQPPEHLYCIMFELSDIIKINQLYGHAKGNALIKDFSDILRIASSDLCFVGRNGGNKFMALFENGTEDNFNIFMERIQQKIEAHNNVPDAQPIVYRYGYTHPEDTAANTITELIALANQRIYK